MRFFVDRRKLFAKLDVLLELLENKQYPFNRPDAIVPQRIIPAELRGAQSFAVEQLGVFHPGAYDARHTLACFYFYVCIYMRGGIESLQAFSAMTRLWRAHPEFFDPFYAQNLSVAYLQPILRKFVGWDSETAAYNWIENSGRLVQIWGGNPLNLLKRLRTWEEACRRIRNKHTKRDQYEAGEDGQGFEGFQYKMVSMLLYFYDWEGWLEQKFPYPSPADFQNFRFGFSLVLIKIVLDLADESKLEQNPGGVVVVTVSEKLSRPWRDAIMAYIISRKADPVKVSDAIWLFPLLLCGNSPATVTKLDPVKKEPRKKVQRGGALAPTQIRFNGEHGFEEKWDYGQWKSGRKNRILMSKAMEQTCGSCPFLPDCKYAIPAKPYYGKTSFGRGGKLVLHEQPLHKLGVTMRPLPPPLPAEVEIDSEIQHLLQLASPVPVPT